MLVFGPLFKVAASWLLFKALTPSEQHEAAHTDLDTSALDELARTDGGTTSTTSTTSASEPLAPTSSTPAASSPAPLAPVVTTPAASSPAPLDRETEARLAAIAETPTSASEVATPASEYTPAIESDAPASVVDDDSAREAARSLHAYVMRTTSARRDRQYIRVLQAAIGGLVVDGLIGRGTAARIKALTGLRIPGLS